jgi:hypothetical protein
MIVTLRRVNMNSGQTEEEFWKIERHRFVKNMVRIISIIKIIGIFGQKAGSLNYWFKNSSYVASFLHT